MYLDHYEVCHGPNHLLAGLDLLEWCSWTLRLFVDYDNYVPRSAAEPQIGPDGEVIVSLRLVQ